MTLYSKRHAVQPASLRHDVPQTVRRRIRHIICNSLPNDSSNWNDDRYERFHDELRDFLCEAYGQLTRPPKDSDWCTLSDPWSHFHACEDDIALDFVEAVFWVDWTLCGGQHTVSRINRVFSEEHCGYRLTDLPLEALTPSEGTTGCHMPDELPRIIRIENEALYQGIVVPALTILRHRLLVKANASLLTAFSDHRMGQNGNAITNCCAALESVLKAICHHKSWVYREDATCAVLVDACYNNNLFESWYVDEFKRIGTIRNKLSSAHGAGPNQKRLPTTAHSEHLLHLTCSHILFLAKLAGLE